MALDQINQYATTASTIDESSYFDIDQWDGVSAWESQKVPPSVMRKAFSTAPIQFAVTGTATDLTVSTFEIEVPIPYGFYATEVRANLITAPTGADAIFDCKMNGVTMLSTLVTIDAGEKTSKTATTPAVISVPSLIDDNVLTVNCTQIGSTIAGAGLTFTINGYRL
jgi:hypothetical protein